MTIVLEAVAEDGWVADFEGWLDAHQLEDAGDFAIARMREAFDAGRAAGQKATLATPAPGLLSGSAFERWIPGKVFARYDVLLRENIRDAFGDGFVAGLDDQQYTAEVLVRECRGK